MTSSLSAAAARSGTNGTPEREERAHLRGTFRRRCLARRSVVGVSVTTRVVTRSSRIFERLHPRQLQRLAVLVDEAARGWPGFTGWVSDPGHAHQHVDLAGSALHEGPG
ncbi:MAG: hypothetical protein IPQ14_10285 [Candidatus Microthrix sp.]|nr:hypothetical protein [Candidatus Microthrix sp.]